MKNFIGGIFLLIACAILGAFLATAGAKISGMKTGMRFEPFIHLVIGLGVSTITFLVLIVLNQRAVVAALGALILAFLAGLVGHLVFEYQNNLNSKWVKALQEALIQSYNTYYSNLRDDPELCLREKWYQASDERYRAYQNSIRNHDVNFSASTLSQLYALDQTTVELLKHPSFDKDLLEREFREALGQALKGGPGCSKLVVILDSPNAKEDWITEVVSSGITDGDICEGGDSLRGFIEFRRKYEEIDRNARGNQR